MQSIRRAIKRGNAVVYDNGRGHDIMRKKGASKKAWCFAKKNEIKQF